MLQALLAFALLCSTVHATPLCIGLVEKAAGQSAVPSDFEQEVWNRFGPPGRMPLLAAGDERQLYLLNELEKQKRFFADIDQSLAETGDIGPTSRQNDHVATGTIGALLAASLAANGQYWLASLVGVFTAPSFYWARQTEPERRALIAEIQSIGVFRFHLQQQAQFLERSEPGTQTHTRKDFASASPFTLLISCRVDSSGTPATLVLFQRPRPDEPYYDSGY